MSEYTPVPVEEAYQIAQNFRKDVVVIIAFDDDHGQVHCTTYGNTAYNKILAAELGPKLVIAAGGFMPEAKAFEDFRDAAVAQERADKRRLVIEKILEFHPQSPETGAELPPSQWAPEYLDAVNACLEALDRPLIVV